MSKFNNITPILWTNSFEETILFYTQVLGFNLNEKNAEWQWASIKKDHISLMISRPNEHAKFKKICFSGSFYFNVNDVDNLWNDVKQKAEICYGIETFEWEMREFAIYDNNGYILQFGENVSEISKQP